MMHQAEVWVRLLPVPKYQYAELSNGGLAAPCRVLSTVGVQFELARVGAWREKKLAEICMVNMENCYYSMLSADFAEKSHPTSSRHLSTGPSHTDIPTHTSTSKGRPRLTA